MQLVDTGQFYPGCCVLGGGHEKLVDFQRHMPLHNEGARMYVSQQLIKDAAALIGMVPREVHADALARVARLQAEVEDLRDVQRELENLRAAVRVTLEAGATVDQRTGEKKLRLPRGVKREEVTV